MKDMRYKYICNVKDVECDRFCFQEKQDRLLIKCFIKSMKSTFIKHTHTLLFKIWLLFRMIVICVNNEFCCRGTEIMKNSKNRVMIRTE